MGPYPAPSEHAIKKEIARLQARYDAFMKARGETADPEQLRAWAIENLREQSILETEAAQLGITVDALLKRIVDAVEPVTVNEAREFFKANPKRFIAPERVHAKHIVLHRQTTPQAEALTTLLNLRAKLIAKTISWEEAVQKYSSCAAQDDLGFFPRGAMEETFENAAFAAEEGSITDVIETPFGWHLIYVVAHLPEEPMLFEEAKEGILAHLNEDRQRTALEQYVDERKQSFE